MLFNQQALFNRSAFNRASTGSSALSGTMQWNFDAAATQPLRTPVPLEGATEITYTTDGKMTVTVLMGNISASIVFDAATTERLRSQLKLDGSTGIAFDANGELINSHAYSITLKGLNLAPSGTVIIDTDTLDIFVNGVLNVMCWQSGGEFFELASGENNIQVYTDGDGSGELTVQWKDRWY